MPASIPSCRRLVLSAALVLCGVASGGAQATVTVYTSLASFNAATTAQGTDTFANLSVGEGTDSPMSRVTTVGTSYSYSADVSTTAFFGVGTAANPALSPNFARDTVTFSGFGSGVYAGGGNFYATDVDGNYVAGSLLLTATDASGTVTQTITPSGVDIFLGFVSSSPLLSFTMAAVQAGPTPPNDPIWPTVDNLVLAAAVPVPEPASVLLLLAGLAAVGTFATRRR